MPIVLLLGIFVLRFELGRKAESELERGRAALESDDPAAARAIFDQALVSRPESAEVHFLAAQAARRCGDLSAAEDQLDVADKLGWHASAIRFERALIRAQSGDLRSVEPILLAGDPRQPEFRHVLAILVPAYMSEFRWLEASELAKTWVELRPESGQAWSYLGEILEHLRKKKEAVAALREAVRLNPKDQKSRLSLARMLLETRQNSAEAAEQLEWLIENEPDNPALLVQMAVCREAQGQPYEAKTLLDRVIAQHPPDAKAYYHRGRLELDSGRPAAALPYLRRSAELDSSDTEVLYSLFVSVQQVGTPDEARVAEDRWRQCDRDLKRVSELARAISSAPHDPELRVEMGKLFLKNGREVDGVRWIKSALIEQPNHREAHMILASYYGRTGSAEKADFHRAQGQADKIRDSE